MLRAALCLSLVTACSSKSEPPRPAPVPEPIDPPAARDDAGASDGSAEPVVGEVPSGTRADQDAPGRPPARAAARVARPIDIILRSSPPGATAAVDGVPIGPTPTYWAGEANGREHEFTFVLPGYAFARYRFVPITSGVVHARLELLTEDTDAGVPAEMIRPDVRAPAATPRPHAPPASSAAQPSEGAAAPTNGAPGTAPAPVPPESAPTAPPLDRK